MVGLRASRAFPLATAWRAPLLIGGIPLVLLVPIWLWVPESPRYLLRQGRRDRVRAFCRADIGIERAGTDLSHAAHAQ
jgi:putative MFS transporter